MESLEQPNSRRSNPANPSSRSLINADPDLEVGSMVEVMSNPPLYGVIRWMGYLPDQKDPVKPIAGLEMVRQWSRAPKQIEICLFEQNLSCIYIFFCILPISFLFLRVFFIFRNALLNKIDYDMVFFVFMKCMAHLPSKCKGVTFHIETLSFQSGLFSEIKLLIFNFVAFLTGRRNISWNRWQFWKA